MASSGKTSSKTTSKTIGEATQLNIKAAEVAMKAPQVVAQRTKRMAKAATSPAGPSAHDQQELMRMGAEKAAAFNASWMAMTRQMFQSNQQWLMSWFRDAWDPAKNPWLQLNYWQQYKQPQPFTFAAMNKASQQAQHAMLDVWNKGITPVHKRVVANQKRLSRAKPR